MTLDSLGNALRNAATKRARNTVLSAFTGNKNLPLLRVNFHTLSLVMPPAGIIQCKCGCSDKCLPPGVQYGNHAGGGAQIFFICCK